MKYHSLWCSEPKKLTHILKARILGQGADRVVSPKAPPCLADVHLLLVSSHAPLSVSVSQPLIKGLHSY